MCELGSLCNSGINQVNHDFWLILYCALACDHHCVHCAVNLLLL